jgi:hypothetical protein
MLDFVPLGRALLVAATVAGVTLLLFTKPVRTPSVWRLRTGWIFGIAAGIYAGCAVLDQWPRWPALEDRDRFLVVLLPLTIVVELVAMSVSSRTWAWLLRINLAAVAAPILLHNSVYVADLAGPNSAEWTMGQAVANLLGLAVLLTTVWGLLARLQTRSSDRTMSLALALVSLAAGITVMLSGYLRGGLLGLPIAGAMLASCFVRPPASVGASLGIGLIGIFTVLLIGRFFGSLPSSTALGLWFAPLLAWIAEIPRLRRFGPRARTAIGCIAVATALIVIVIRAQMKFSEAFKARPNSVTATPANQNPKTERLAKGYP